MSVKCQEKLLLGKCRTVAAGKFKVDLTICFGTENQQSNIKSIATKYARFVTLKKKIY